MKGPLAAPGGSIDSGGAPHIFYPGARAFTPQMARLRLLTTR